MQQVSKWRLTIHDYHRMVEVGIGEIRIVKLPAEIIERYTGHPQTAITIQTIQSTNVTARRCNPLLYPAQPWRASSADPS
jgi:hypothetical protein